MSTHHFRIASLTTDTSRGPDANDVARAKELCEDLLANVRKQYEQFKERGPSHDRGYGGGSYGNNRGYGDRDRGSYGGGYGGGGAYGGHQSPSGQAAAMSPTSAAAPGTAGGDYAAQYAQYYGGQDPYAAYGGYQAYVAMYYNYYQQQQPGTQQSPPGAPPGAASASSSAPPPPPGEAPPPPPPGGSAPPPPPSASPPGVYNAVRASPRFSDNGAVRVWLTRVCRYRLHQACRAGT